MLEILNQVITYKQLVTGNYQIGNDLYGIASYVLTPSRIAAVKNCPFNISDNACAYFFVNVDGIVAARVQLFGTQFYVDGKVNPSGSGSSWETAECFRHQALGAEVMLFTSTNDEYETFIASGISDMALPLYKKLRYYILEFPRIMQLRNAYSILECKGLNGTWLKVVSTLVNLPLKLFIVYSKHKGKKLLKEYQVEKVIKVPEWVDNIVLNDGHKYMEAHDHRWLQWNLDYNFRGLPQDIQSFYTIKKKGEPVGFFMTKERFRKKAGGLKNILIGAIMEWGSVNEKQLSEADIYKMAQTTFSREVDIVEAATANPATVEKMKVCGFISRGYAHIAFKDKKKKYKDASDINLWRGRYGYADVLLT